MARKRFSTVGDASSTEQRAAIEHVYAQLPDHDPYHGRALVDLHDPGTGAIHDLDAIVIGESAIYLLEFRDYAGLVEGDDLDWLWTGPDGRRRHIEHPLRALRVKHQAFAALFAIAARQHGRLRSDQQLPPIQSLVFLGAEELNLQVTPAGRGCVVQRSEIAAALRRHEFPGASEDSSFDRITSIHAQSLMTCLDALGLRARGGPPQAGAYRLGPSLAEGRGYQDREAAHRDEPTTRRRARTYLIPEHADQAARLNLRREADRDANLLLSVRKHAYVLAAHEYIADAPLGPTLILDRFEGGVPLREFLARRPAFPFAERVAILEQVALALAHCHRRVVYHGGLGPDSVLVRKLDTESPPEVRISNFQAGRSIEVSPTIHRTRFASVAAAAFQAPELFSAPDALSPSSDLFSLGALGYFLLTGQAPAPSGVELQRRLAREGSLDPRTVNETVPDAIAEAIIRATRMSASARGDSEHGADVGAWIEGVRLGLCPRNDSTGFVEPLQARPGDRLREDLEVVGVLGRGASACVLEVLWKDQRVALKVSLGPAQDERLREEAGALKRLRHPRIVHCHQSLLLGERQCLLVTLAGPRTLQQAIEQQGSIDLDLALRYGEDLLAALEHLEAKNIGHRDIKPANLGEGSLSNKAKRLTLFDFSLAGIDDTQLDGGTACYRDPYLPLRGRWDPAADRWSAALVLHEMLTGVRPHWKPRGTSPLAPDAILLIASERFDPGARDRLTRFFTTALARELPARFASATAMRAAWSAVVDTPRSTATSPEAPRVSDDARRQLLASVAEDAPLDALPLGVRARNALDRAGLTRATELLALPDNRLSAIRGAGSKVAREIDELRQLWLGLRAAPVSPCFFPQYRGHDLAIDLAELPTATTRALMDAGLDHLTAVAAAPHEQLATLARRHGFDLIPVQAALQGLHDGAEAREHPATSQAWVDALFAASPHVRRWLGLEAPLYGGLTPTIAEVAAAGAVSTPVVSRELVRTRERNRQHPSLTGLAEAVAATVDDLGGVAPLLRAAEAFRARLGEPADDPDALIRATALVRWIAELPDQDHVTGIPHHNLRLERLDTGRPEAAAWVSRDPTYSELVRRLGEIADRLAAREILAAPAEAEAELRAVARGTPLESVPQGRLLDLAAQASRTAVCSSRLELYRRDLDAERAVLHAAPALTGELTPAEVEQRVRARYPESAAVPPRPDLDRLLAPLGLHWAGDRYRRRGDEPRSSLHTLNRATVRRPTAHPSEPPSRSSDAVQSREFEARLELALRGRECLALTITPHHADRAAAELARVVKRPAVLLDRRLIAALEAVARDYAIDPVVLLETDRAGASSPEFPNLCRLAAEAAERLADELLPIREPLLLARPGLLARFRLTNFLHRAIQATRDVEAASLLILIPCHRAHAIEDFLPVPGLPAAQRITVPEPWLLNSGRAATDHPGSS